MPTLSEHTFGVHSVPLLRINQAYIDHISKRYSYWLANKTNKTKMIGLDQRTSQICRIWVDRVGTSEYGSL